MSIWRERSRRWAKLAHDRYFASRHRMFKFDKNSVIVLCDNNPYADFPTFRDRQIATFRKKLRLVARKGIRELTRPVGGPDCGCPHGVVVCLPRRGRRQAEHLVIRLYHEATVEAIRRIKRRRKGGAR